MNNDKKQTKAAEATLPDEQAGIVVSSHLLIRDRGTGKVLVNQRAS